MMSMALTFGPRNPPHRRGGIQRELLMLGAPSNLKYPSKRYHRCWLSHVASIVERQVVTEGILLGMGTPLLDISAVVTAEFLRRYDLKPGESIVADEKHLPMYDELAAMPNVEYIVGGSTQNSIRVAQWMLQTPKATSYIGCVGRDRFGKMMKTKIEIEGVHAGYFEDQHAPTGVSAVCVFCGERSLVARLSAAERYKSEYLKIPESWELVEKAKYIYVDGFFWRVSQEATLLVAQHALTNRKTFIVNLSAPFVCEILRDALFLQFADFVFGNETEAIAFSHVHGWETDDVSEIALKIAALPKASGTHKRVVVITQGSDPVVVAQDGKVKLFPVVFLPEEKLVDTTGAGDAFVGGFLSQLVQEKSIEDCLRAGAYASYMIIQRPGCTYPEKPTFR